MENLAQAIARLSRELNQARSTRDRIEKIGLSASFGGNTFAQANYEQVLKRIRQLERDLYRAESLAAGSDNDPSVRVSVVSQL